MAIASHKPDTESRIAVRQPAVEDNYQSVILDNNTNSLKSVITYIQGSKQSCTYYNQVSNEHTDVRMSDPGQLQVYQQYLKISGLELLVDTPLNYSQDQSTNLVTVTGSASVLPVIVPSSGDVFVITLIDNRIGLFSVTAVERLTFNKDSVYKIEYVLVEYITGLHDLKLATVESKVNKEYFYSHDRLINGQMPLLNTEQFQSETNLLAYRSELVKYYFKRFYDKTAGMPILPIHEPRIMDTFVLEFMLKYVSTTDAPEVAKVQLRPTDSDQYLKQPTLYDAISERSKVVLRDCNKKMNLVSTTIFSSNVYLRSVRFSNIDYCIYPVDADVLRYETVVDGLPLVVKEFASLNTTYNQIDATTATHGAVYNATRDRLTIGNIGIPYIKDVLCDEYYVFSTDFYNNVQGGCSVLESLVLQFLNKEMMDVTKLIDLLNRYSQWNRLEQFYYIPILYVLVCDAIKTLG